MVREPRGSRASRPSVGQKASQKTSRKERRRRWKTRKRANASKTPTPDNTDEESPDQQIVKDRNEFSTIEDIMQYTNDALCQGGSKGPTSNHQTDKTQRADGSSTLKKERTEDDTCMDITSSLAWLSVALGSTMAVGSTAALGSIESGDTQKETTKVTGQIDSPDMHHESADSEPRDMAEGVEIRLYRRKLEIRQRRDNKLVSTVRLNKKPKPKKTKLRVVPSLPPQTLQKIIHSMFKNQKAQEEEVETNQEAKEESNQEAKEEAEVPTQDSTKPQAHVTIEKNTKQRGSSLISITDAMLLSAVANNRNKTTTWVPDQGSSTCSYDNDSLSEYFSETSGENETKASSTGEETSGASESNGSGVFAVVDDTKLSLAAAEYLRRKNAGDGVPLCGVRLVSS